MGIGASLATGFFLDENYALGLTAIVVILLGVTLAEKRASRRRRTERRNHARRAGPESAATDRVSRLP